jgi:hypothetical protein
LTTETKKQNKKTMENSLKEQRQKDIYNLEKEIKEMKQTLKNSKDYLLYMKECLREIEEQEKKEIENNLK